MTNLQSRIVVAAVAIPLILGVSYLGGVAFFLFVLLVSSLALEEFYKLSALKGARPSSLVGMIIGGGISLTFLHDTLQVWIFRLLGDSFAFPTKMQLFMIVLILSVVLVALVELFRGGDSSLLNLGVTVLGFVYISVFLASLIGVRELFVPLEFPMVRYFGTESSFFDPERIRQVYDWGGYTVMMLFACIWLCDTAAYTVGMKMGRHKLFPRVSPNKTWEGALAGLVVAVGTAIVVKSALLEYLSVAQAGVIGGIVGIIGQAGDLVESLMKRDAGVKDSSDLIPGHGGVFDRFDSLIFVAPVVYLYLEFGILS